MISSLSGKDYIVLSIMWGLIAISSIYNLGYIAGCAFLIMNMFLVIRNTISGILVLLIIAYTPAVSLNFPNIFMISSFIIISKVFIVDFCVFKKTIRNNALIVSMVLFLAYLLPLLFVSSDFSIALRYYTKYLAAFAFVIMYFMVTNSEEHVSLILRWWSIVAGLAIVIKIIHVLLGDSTHLYQLISEASNDSLLDEKTNINVGGSLVNRLIWPGEEPNYSSADLVFPFAIALAFFTSSKTITKYLWLLLCAIIVLSIAGTYSRSGFIAICLIVTMYAIKRNIKALIPITLLASGLLYYLSRVPELFSRVMSIGDSVNSGASDRFRLWTLAINMWEESPLFGSGLASYFIKYKNATHNTYLQLLAETGLVGFILFVVVILVAIKYCLNYFRYYDNNNLTMSILLYGFIAFVYMTATLTYQDPKMLWLGCALISSKYLIAARSNAFKYPQDSHLEN